MEYISSHSIGEEQVRTFPNETRLRYILQKHRFSPFDPSARQRNRWEAVTHMKTWKRFQSWLHSHLGIMIIDYSLVLEWHNGDNGIGVTVGPFFLSFDKNGDSVWMFCPKDMKWLSDFTWGWGIYAKAVELTPIDDKEMERLQTEMQRTKYGFSHQEEEEAVNRVMDVESDDDTMRRVLGMPEPDPFRGNELPTIPKPWFPFDRESVVIEDNGINEGNAGDGSDFGSHQPTVDQELLNDPPEDLDLEFDMDDEEDTAVYDKGGHKK